MWSERNPRTLAAVCGIIFGGLGDAAAQLIADSPNHPSDQPISHQRLHDPPSMPVPHTPPTAAARSEEPSTPTTPPVQRSRVDSTRLAAVALYYSVSGVVFYHPLYAWMDRMFGMAGIRAALLKVSIDCGVALPFVELPCFYVCTLSPRQGVEGALLKLREDYWRSLVAGWATWVPCSICVFSLAPPHYRLPIFMFTDGLWACIVSYFANSRSPPAIAGMPCDTAKQHED